MINHVDKRTKYIVDTVKSLLNADNTDSIDTGIINHFISTIECNALHIQYDSTTQQYIVNTDINHNNKENQNNTKNKNHQLYITKKQVDHQLSTDLNQFIQQLSIASTYDDSNSLNSLYSLLHNIYLPLTKYNKTIDQQVAEKLLSVDSILQQTCGVYDSIVSSSIDDEHKYWSTHTTNNDVNIYTQQLYQLIYDNTNELKRYTLDEMQSVMCTVQECVSDLYTSNHKIYTQKHIAHLMNLLSNYVCDNIQLQLKSSSLFSSTESPLADSYLQQCMNLLNEWNTICSDLCTVDWQSMWIGDIYTNSHCKSLYTRIQLVQQYIGVLSEISFMFGSSEQSKFSVHKLYKCFDGVDVSNINYNSQLQFQSCCDEFNRLIVPIEAAAASMLKSKLSSLSDRPRLLTRELRHYNYLLQRRSISHAIDNEKLQLVKQIHAQIRSIQSEFEHVSGDSHSNVADNMLCTHQIHGRLISMQSIISIIFNDTVQCNEFDSNNNDQLTKTIALISDTINRVSEWCTDTYKQWEQHQLSSITNKLPGICVDVNGNVIRLDKRAGGKLRVTYSSSLVQFIREVRCMSELEYSIHSTISHAVNTAEKFYRNALKLSQIATTYNNMSSEINKSQLSMVLLEARNFESLINSNDSTAQWSNIKLTDKYVDSLTDAADKLVSRNRYLKNVHDMIGDELMKCMKINLVIDRDQYIHSIQQIRNTIERLGQSGKNTVNAMKIWKRYWDEQLYKSLYIHYQITLQSMISGNTAKQHNIDLTFDNQHKQLRITRVKHRNGAFTSSSNHTDNDAVELIDDIKSDCINHCTV